MMRRTIFKVIKSGNIWETRYKKRVKLHLFLKTLFYQKLYLNRLINWINFWPKRKLELVKYQIFNPTSKENILWPKFME